MLHVSQCRKIVIPSADQLKKNGAARAPMCIADIQTTTTQSTFAHLS